jgi:hypothetical protein
VHGCDTSDTSQAGRLELGPHAAADGRLAETVSFADELARKGPAGA